MKIETQCDPQQVDRKGERGAALLTVLLISILLLSAGMALVTTTSLSTTGTIDSTAEMQAYFAAEAGLEATINVLRGNVALHDMTPTTTMMNFRTAVLPAVSNKTTDTSAVGRLSGWLTYSYQNPSAATDWRVPLTASYTPLTGLAYKVEITDPDDPTGVKINDPTTSSYVPSRILVRCEGFGPKGAIKRLEMIVTSAGIDIKAPGAITLAGGPIAIDLGDSASVEYTGNDMSLPPKPAISAVAVSPGNEATAQTAMNSVNNASQVQPNTAGTISSTNGAAFLQSADAARAFLTLRRANATENSRLFSTKQAAIDATPWGLGTTDHPTFTFIDNYSSGVAVDLGSGHQGSGLLIVTGDLDTNGNTYFEGLILVLGRGNVTRSGGGDGVIRGSIIVANFDPDGAPGTGFGSPSFSISGGGTSKIGYDSQWIDKARDLLGVSIAGVREYH